VIEVDEDIRTRYPESEQCEERENQIASENLFDPKKLERAQTSRPTKN
jgi:hypothetical protein